MLFRSADQYRDAEGLDALIDKLDQLSEISARQTGALQIAAAQLVDQTLGNSLTRVGDDGELLERLRDYVTRRSGIPEVIQASNSRDVYVCHSTEDKAVARRLAEDISKRGFPVWLRGWEMRPADSLHERLVEAVSPSYWFVVLLTEASVSREWCTVELQALTEEDCRDRIFVLPVLIGECQIPEFLIAEASIDCRGDNYAIGLEAILGRLLARAS